MIDFMMVLYLINFNGEKLVVAFSILDPPLFPYDHFAKVKQLIGISTGVTQFDPI